MNEFMISFLENWYIIFALAVTAVVGIVVTVRQLSLRRVKEWLKYAVSLAEKELGSGTGQLKLRKVYDDFITKYPWISLMISFETFSTLVDEALVWLRTQINDNKNIKNYVSE